MRTIILVFALTAIFITSCTSKEKSEKIEKVSTLLSQVKITREQLISIKLAEIKSIDSVFVVDLQTMNSSNVDFNNPEAKVIVDYMKLRRPFMNFIRDYSRTITQFDSLQSRLYSLKVSVKKDKIQPKEFNQAYLHNKSILNDLKTRTSRIISGVKQNKQLREGLRSRFVEFIGKK